MKVHHNPLYGLHTTALQLYDWIILCSKLLLKWWLFTYSTNFTR